MDRSSSSGILCTMKQRKLASSSSTKRSCYHNNNIGGTANTMKKKGPMKVVYISNPVRFKVTPSEFRSLVQELTGQDSEDLPTHQLQFNVASSCSSESLQFNKAEEEEDKGVSNSLLLQPYEEQVHQATTTTTEEEEDDVFTPLENLSDLFLPNSGFLVL